MRDLMMTRWVHREPTLEDMLSDAIVRDVMEADGVDPLALAAMLRDVGRELRRSSCVPDAVQRVALLRTGSRVFPISGTSL
jgi:hypothetical protein